MNLRIQKKKKKTKFHCFTYDTRFVQPAYVRHERVNAVRHQVICNPVRVRILFCVSEMCRAELASNRQRTGELVEKGSRDISNCIVLYRTNVPKCTVSLKLVFELLLFVCTRTVCK